jgi:hypothetical protein
VSEKIMKWSYSNF